MKNLTIQEFNQITGDVLDTIRKTGVKNMTKSQMMAYAQICNLNTILSISAMSEDGITFDSTKLDDILCGSRPDLLEVVTSIVQDFLEVGLFEPIGGTKYRVHVEHIAEAMVQLGDIYEERFC
jgi:hypothetical protein